MKKGTNPGRWCTTLLQQGDAADDQEKKKKPGRKNTKRLPASGSPEREGSTQPYNGKKTQARRLAAPDL